MADWGEGWYDAPTEPDAHVQRSYERMTNADRRQVLLYATVMADRLRLESPYPEAQAMWERLCESEPEQRLSLLQRLLNSSHLSWQMLHPWSDVDPDQ